MQESLLNIDGRSDRIAILVHVVYDRLNAKPVAHEHGLQC